MSVSVTVAICTHNRSDDLAIALEALDGQPREGLEFLVVDSASEPTHAEALRTLCAARPWIRLMRTEQPGLSVARNHALDAAAGPWIAYLDDDATPAHDYAATLRRLAESAGERIGGFGGWIGPEWPTAEDPVHMGPRWRAMLSLIEREGGGSLSEGHQIFGANFVLRTGLARQFGGFPATLGRVGNNLLGGEEIYLVGRIRAAGYDVFYTDALRVAHRIQPERLTLRWALRRAFWGGVSDVVLHRMLYERPPYKRPPFGLSLPRLICVAPALLAMLAVNPRSTELKIRNAFVFGALAAKTGLVKIDTPAAA